jgi:hypothetical protein
MTKKPERIAKKEFTGKCPYCKSAKTEKGVLTYIVGNGKPNIECWHCFDCKAVFELF